MAEEEKKTDISTIRDNILSKYAQAGLNDKDAAEKADAFLREHAFRPHAAEINPQLAGLMERAAEAARQQAAEKKSAEQEKTAPAAAPAEKAAEKKSVNESPTQQYASELKEITGTDWEAKEAVGYDETQGKTVSYNHSLCVPTTPEMVAKLEEKGIRYSNLENIDGKNFIAVDTTKPLFLTKEEVNKKAYAAELKEITGEEWGISQGLDPDGDDILKQKEALCVIKTPEMVAKLEEKGIRYGRLITTGEADVIAVDIDKPLYLTDEEMKEKNKTMEAAAKEGEKLSPAQPVVEEVKADEEIQAAPVEDVKDAQEDVPVFSAGVKQSDNKENQTVSDKGNTEQADMDELFAQMDRTAWKNKFMYFEDEEENEGKPKDQKHKCPFSLCQSITKHDEQPPHVSMKLETGTTLDNHSKSVNMSYKEAVPSFEDCMTMVRVGMEKGWKGAKLEGPEEYKAQMYLAMRAMGMKVIGYTPSPELEKKGNALADIHAKDREHAESMDQRYPALDKARDGMAYKDVDAEKYKAIRAKAEENEAVKQAEDKKVEKPAKTAEAKPAAKPAGEKKVEMPVQAQQAEKPAKTAEAEPAAKPAGEKKAELSGKFDKMLETLREQHPNVARKQDFNGKSPAEMLKAYGNALNAVKASEVKGSTKAAPDKANSSVLNAAKNRSGQGR